MDNGVNSFKAEVGRLILIGAVAYCALLTIGLVASTVLKCDIPQHVREILVIILTWFTTKAGTVVDHQYGTSAGSESKTDFMMQELKKGEDAEWVKPPEEPEPPKPSV